MIEQKDTVKDLGVSISADNTFKVHISNIAESAKKMASWVLRTFETRERIPMMTLYKRERKKPYGITLITCNSTLVYIIDYL